MLDGPRAHYLVAFRCRGLRACRAAGFDTAGKLSAVASPGSSAAEQRLPETGGPALPALLLSAAVLLSAGGLLALRTAVTAEGTGRSAPPRF